MGLIFILLLIIGLVTWMSYEGTVSKAITVKRSNAWAGLVISTVIATIMLSIIFLASYNSYIELAQKLATVEQYKESIELYADKGIQEFQPGTTRATEFTDLKYNNYQTQIGQMIKDMRDTIVEYNKDLTKKKLRKSNWFFSWITIVDEDMKLIKMADYIK